MDASDREYLIIICALIVLVIVGISIARDQIEKNKICMENEYNYSPFELFANTDRTQKEYIECCVDVTFKNELKVRQCANVHKSKQR